MMPVRLPRIRFRSITLRCPPATETPVPLFAITLPTIVVSRSGGNGSTSKVLGETPDPGLSRKIEFTTYRSPPELVPEYPPEFFSAITESRMARHG
jgi:hypothetical protein